MRIEIGPVDCKFLKNPYHNVDPAVEDEIFYIHFIACNNQIWYNVTKKIKLNLKWGHLEIQYFSNINS